MSTTEVPFSQLLREPTATVGKLEESQSGRLRLARRDGEDLILESAERAEAKAAAWSTTTRLFVSLMKQDDGARALLMALPDVFPWVRFLPTEDVQAFLVELVDVANACAELSTLAPIEAVVAAWRATANVHADPELRAALLAPSDEEDHGPVPPPGEK
ncbi:hypothetical protein DPM19_20915 [Actinomadura craniellae]|uniref:Prevent-host-death family protein n=1 Tax=Actinomadura craniellae TaxID=2231787 RepID=A0A365H3G3_9ACTN|nr:hypothetical protein [Actinomadura craniellae]RAY13558.1 hypothetical protein DPM19_20915 [Actinomadura craniellae]